MENRRTPETSFASVDEVLNAADPGPEYDPELDFDRELEALIEEWAKQNEQERGEYSEARECLDGLLETRAVMASMQAQERRFLARLQELALDDAGPHSSGATRELAWRSMAAEIGIATNLADRSVQSMMSRAGELVAKLPLTLAALEAGTISIGHARVILEHCRNIEDADLAEYERITVASATATT